MKIAFTSCMDASRVPLQPVWERIKAVEPDALMLLGDNIYMDWGLRALAKTPHWRRRWDKAPKGTDARTEVLDTFSRDMHRRYKMQWEVQSFKELITWFVARRGPEMLYVIRDEHDMAWNNARGAGDERDPKWVPPDIAERSRLLFEQFRSVLAAPGKWASAYPEISAALTPAPAPRTQLGPFKVLLQDQRSHRSVRFVLPDQKAKLNPEARLLSGDAKKDMLAEFKDPKCPLLLVGSSPLWHDYSFSEQGWWSPTTPYPEYKELIDAAKRSNRAVLYLGGDIHNLAYGGPVESSPVVQMLASGAAVSGVFRKKHPACFAWLDVTTHGDSGTVALHGVRDEKDMPYPLLQFSGHQWASEPPAGVAPAEPERYDLGTLAVLTVRQRESHSEQEGQLDVPMDALDSLYGDELSGYNNVPLSADAVTVTQDPPHSTKIRLDRGGRVDALIEAAFERARVDGRNVVTFFIHGFDHSFAESLDQACALRERFNVEPVLFSWPAGEDGGWLKTKLEVGEAARRCGMQAEALRVALKTFAEVAKANSGINATIVARSLGAFALQKAINPTRQSRQLPGEMGSVKRVLLSAPAVDAGSQTKWLELLGDKLVITINATDDTLDHGTLLGRTLPSDQDRVPGARYLQWREVGTLHDYLLTSLGDGGDRLNQKLVRGEPFEVPDLLAARVSQC